MPGTAAGDLGEEPASPPVELGAGPILEGCPALCQSLFFEEGSAGDLGGESQSVGSVAARCFPLDGRPDLSQGLLFEEGSEAGELGRGDTSHQHTRTPYTHAAHACRPCIRQHERLPRTPSHAHTHTDLSRTDYVLLPLACCVWVRSVRHLGRPDR